MPWVKWKTGTDKHAMQYVSVPRGRSRRGNGREISSDTTNVCLLVELLFDQFTFILWQHLTFYLCSVIKK